MSKTKTFEESYRRYPFAPLVEFGIAVAAWLKSTFCGKSANGKDGRHSRMARGAVGHAA